MKLYEVPSKTYIKVLDDVDGYYFFDHLDGMYSVCFDIEDRVHHISVSTEVKIVQPPPTW